MTVDSNVLAHVIFCCTVLLLQR